MRRRHHHKTERLQGRRVVTDHCGPTGKARYRSEGAAVEALRRIRLQSMADHDGRRKEVRVYSCRLCLGFHLSKGSLRQDQRPDGRQDGAA